MNNNQISDPNQVTSSINNAHHNLEIHAGQNNMIINQSLLNRSPSPYYYLTHLLSSISPRIQKSLKIPINLNLIFTPYQSVATQMTMQVNSSMDPHIFHDNINKNLAIINSFIHLVVTAQNIHHPITRNIDSTPYFISQSIYLLYFHIYLNLPHSIAMHLHLSYFNQLICSNVKNSTCSKHLLLFLIDDVINLQLCSFQIYKYHNPNQMLHFSGFYQNIYCIRLLRITNTMMMR